MFVFEGFILMFLAATPMAFLIVFNRDQYKLPRFMFYLSLLVLLASTLVLIGGFGIKL